MHAVARLALHPLITNIQTSWVKMGRDGAKAAFAAGANDLGGTLMNESITRAAGAMHGQEMPPEAMEDADPLARAHATAAHHALSAGADAAYAVVPRRAPVGTARGHTGPQPRARVRYWTTLSDRDLGRHGRRGQRAGRAARGGWSSRHDRLARC